jgi:hypothetical protein
LQVWDEARALHLTCVSIATPVRVGVAQILHLTENGYALVKP